MTDEWITTKEAVELTGYHPDHLRRLIRGGEVAARKFGIVWQVDKQSLLIYAESAKLSDDKRRGPKE